MFETNALNQFKEKLSQAKSLLILLPPQPDTDTISAGLSLYLSFKQKGKKIKIGCTSDPKVSDSHLFGIADIKKTIGAQNLIISFDYKEESVEHVSYDIDEETGKFNLKIRTKKGSKPLNTKTIQYAYTGAEGDLIIVLGINSLEELGGIYSDEKEFLDQADKVLLSLKPQKPEFEAINLSAKSSSLSETAGLLLKSTGTHPTADAATNLYHQILSSTNNFTSPIITPETLELAAFLLRSGASKTHPRPQSQPTHQLPPQPKKPKPFNPPPTFFTDPVMGESELPPHPADPFKTPTPPEPKEEVPDSWQTPKIFRSTPNTK